MDTETTNKLIARLAVLASEASDKVESGMSDDQATYWRGVVSGLETAIVELRLAIEPLAGLGDFSKASIESMEDDLAEGDYP